MLGWRVLLWAALVGAALMFLYAVRGILPPFIGAILLASILDPATRKLQKRGHSRGRAVLTVWGAFMGILIALTIWLTPVVSAQVITFKDKIDLLSAQVSEQSAQANFFLKWNPRVQLSDGGTAGQLDQFFEQNEDTLQKLGLPTTRADAVKEYVEPHRNEITKAVQTLFGGVLGLVSALGSQALLMLFTPFFALVMMMEIDRFKIKMAGLIPPSIRSDTLALLQDVGNVIAQYIRGVSIVLFYYAIAASIVLSILGAPYALLLALLFTCIYLIPYIGALLNLALLVMLIGTSGRLGVGPIEFASSWTYGIVAAVIYSVIFFIFDQLVYFRLVGKSVGLHPLVSFFVVFSAATLFGPLGMILAFPVAGSVKIILDRLIDVTSRTQDFHLPSVPLRHRSS